LGVVIDHVALKRRLDHFMALWRPVVLLTFAGLVFFYVSVVTVLYMGRVAPNIFSSNANYFNAVNAFVVSCMLAVTLRGVARVNDMQEALVWCAANNKKLLVVERDAVAQELTQMPIAIGQIASKVSLPASFARVCEAQAALPPPHPRRRSAQNGIKSREVYRIVFSLLLGLLPSLSRVAALR
jgi:hypothetical protein